MHYTHFLQRAKGWQLRPLAGDCAPFHADQNQPPWKSSAKADPDWTGGFSDL